MPLGNPFGYAMGQRSGSDSTPAPKAASRNPFQNLSFGEWLRSKQRPGAGERKVRARQTADAQFNALHQRLAQKKAQGPMQAQTGGMARQAFAQAPSAEEAVGPMQSILQAGMSAPEQQG